MMLVGFCFVLGLIIGSFLNVVILRYGHKGIGGRSECMHCHTQIAWYDNLPVLSWVVLRGKCRSCSAHISLQYPLVELLTGVLFAFVAAAPREAFTWTFLPHLGIVALLVAIAVHDLRTTIIPDPWVYSFALLAFITQPLFTLPLTPGVSILPSLLAGVIVAAPLFGLWFFSRGAWMGFGDVKFALGMGWLLGPLYGTVALFFAFVIGAIVSVFVLLPLPHIVAALRQLGITSLAPAGKGFTIKSEIPFGPFLVASTLIVWLLIMYSIDPLVLVGW